MSARVGRAPSTANARKMPRPIGAPTEVFINGRFLSQKTEGVQRAAEEIVRALDALLSDGVIDQQQWKVTLLAPRDSLRDLDLRSISTRRVGWLRGHSWEQVELPWYARGGVLLSLCNAATVLKSRHVAMLYDAAVFAAASGYSWRFAAWYRLLFSSLGRTARTILTSSTFSAQELSRHAGVPQSKLEVVPLGGQHLAPLEADRAVLGRHNLRGERYVLAVGSLNPNKNFHSVLEALRHYPAPRPKLVVAGGANARVFRDGSREPMSRDGVTYVGYVSDAQLKALYEGASAFVFPSVYEGFGFPPLEAMTCGCPAVVSDIPVLREVCGDAAAYFDPYDPHDIARSLHEVLEDEALTLDLRSRGFRRVQRFTWERCARAVWAAVQATAEGKERGSP